MQFFRWIGIFLHLIGIHIYTKRDKTQKAQLIPLEPFKYNRNKDAWESEVTGYGVVPKTIRVATHNVLKSEPWWVLELFLQSPKRFAHEMVILEDLDADVICLNEVTPMFLKMLLEQEWVRTDYFVSDAFVPNSDYKTVHDSVFSEGVPMGNVILSRFPMSLSKFEFSYKANCKRDAIVATFDDLTICAVHLSAWKQLYERRYTQLQELTSHLPTQNTVILGDLNFQVEAENVTISKCDYVDMWTATEKDPFGYTWDSVTNHMIQRIIPFMNKSMRLDRIIMSERSKWETDQIRIFANEPVEQNRYLFCSDHYGLITTLSH
jgi:poly(A) polymerase